MTIAEQFDHYCFVLDSCLHILGQLANDNLNRTFTYVDMEMERKRPISGQELSKKATEALKFVMTQIEPFWKFFDCELDEEDPKNYYMEREWRLPGVLEFFTKGVRKVFLPEDFAESFRNDFPQYRNQLLFVSEPHRQHSR